METTACHFHCSRELGALLPLSDRSEVDLNDHSACYWVDIIELDRLTVDGEGMGHWEFLLQSIRKRQEQSREGMLTVVASWGRNDFLQRVLQSHELLSFRRPDALAAALQRVLQQASDPAFDVALVATLLEHGATTSDLYLPKLFTVKTGADPFGYFSALNEGLYDRVSVHSLRRLVRGARHRAVRTSEALRKRVPTRKKRSKKKKKDEGRPGDPASMEEASIEEEDEDEGEEEDEETRPRRKVTTGWSRDRKNFKKKTGSGGGSPSSGEFFNMLGRKSKSAAMDLAEQLHPANVVQSIADARPLAHLGEMVEGVSSSLEVALEGSHGPNAPGAFRNATRGMMAPAAAILGEDHVLLGGADGSVVMAPAKAVVSPWQQKHITLMASLVPGFEVYAPMQRNVNTSDLVVWAQAAGNMELAHLLWTRCRSPLRTALIGAKVCDKISAERNTLEHELHEAGIRFTQGSLGILNNLPSLGEARKLLLSDQGDFATLGMAGMRRISVLDLAIENDNKDFVADRFCQRVLDELWWGLSPRCGRVRLRHEPATWRIYAAPFAMILGIRLLPLEANEHYPFAKDVTGVRVLQQMVDVWKIPLIKRAMTTFFFVVFVFTFTFGFAFLPMCGPLLPNHYVAAAWLLTIFAEELYLFCQSPTLWGSNRRAVLFTCSLLLLLAGVVLRFYQRDAHIRPSAFTTPTITRLFLDLSAYDPALSPEPEPDLVGSSYLVETASGAVTFANNYSASSNSGSGTSDVDPTPVDPLSMEAFSQDIVCPGSIEDELLRMLIGGPCIFLFMRLFELFDYNKSFGVIQTCIGKMLHQMAKWMVPMLFLDLAFSTAFSVMAPNYHAENSGAPLRIMANLDLSTGGSFWLPFWGMYGIVGPQEVGASDGCVLLAPFLLWFYLLIALVLFINLLIAMFNDTYVAITEKSEAQWKMMRVNKVKAYYARHPAPAPLIVPCLLLQLIAWPICKLGELCGLSACKKTDEAKRIRKERHHSSSVSSYIDPKEAALIEMTAFERYLNPPILRSGGMRMTAGGQAQDDKDASQDAKLSALEERISSMELASAQRQSDLLQRMEDLLSGKRLPRGQRRESGEGPGSRGWTPDASPAITAAPAQAPPPLPMNNIGASACTPVSTTCTPSRPTAPEPLVVSSSTVGRQQPRRPRPPSPTPPKLAVEEAPGGSTRVIRRGGVAVSAMLRARNAGSDAREVFRL